MAELAPLMQAKGGRVKEPGPARYRNPDDPTQTWSGRGRRPRWFSEVEAAGRPLSELEVTGA